MEPDIQQKFDEQQKKLDAILSSVEKTRKYFLIVMWVTIATVLLPILGLIFIIPTFISTYTTALGGLL